MRHYIAVVHKDPGSDYGVSFPDFPGAVTAARTADEAIALAEEALALHVEGMLEDGDTIPEPSGLDQIKSNPDYRDALPVLVPLRTDALAMRVNITLPAAILRRIDDYVDERNDLSRSAFLAAAAQHELARAAQPKQHGKKNLKIFAKPAAGVRYKRVAKKTTRKSHSTRRGLK